MMFQHVFAEMNEILDEIAQSYSSAKGAHKQELSQKWQLLKHMSDGIIEEWLCFEEKMGAIREGWGFPEVPYGMVLQETGCEAFIKGQGYYKLLMFEQAVDQFGEVTDQYPDSLMARIYLAMAYLQMSNEQQAAHNFEWILTLTDNKRLRSIIYNVLGCIEAKGNRMDRAQKYFSLAHQMDPSMPEPLANLEVCKLNQGQLQYGSQLSSLL